MLLMVIGEPGSGGYDGKPRGMVVEAAPSTAFVQSDFASNRLEGASKLV
jgi:hypothetical protein